MSNLCLPSHMCGHYTLFLSSGTADRSLILAFLQLPFTGSSLVSLCPSGAPGEPCTYCSKAECSLQVSPSRRGLISFPPPNVAQYGVCFTEDKSTLLAHDQPGICCNPQVLPSKAAPHPAASQLVSGQGLFLAHVQDLALFPAVPRGFLLDQRLPTSLWVEALLLFASPTLQATTKCV